MSVRLPYEIWEQICGDASLSTLMRVRESNPDASEACRPFYEQKRDAFMQKIYTLLSRFVVNEDYLAEVVEAQSGAYTLYLEHTGEDKEGNYTDRSFRLYHNNTLIYQSPSYPIYKRKYLVGSKEPDTKAWRSFVVNLEQILLKYEIEDFTIV